MTRQPYGVSRLRKAIVYFITGRAVQAIARAILLILLVRLLDVGDYGAYMLLVGLSEMMLRLVSFGTLPMVQRYIPELVSKLSSRNLFRFVGIIIILQAIILSVAATAVWKFWEILTPTFGFSAGQIDASRLAVFLFLLVPAFRLACEILETLLEQGKAQVARALMPIGRLMGIGVILLAGLQVELPFIFTVDIVVTTVCLLLAYWLLIRSLLSLDYASGDGALPVGDMVRFAWHMAAVDILGSTGSPGALRMVLANTLGVVESGLFAFLQSLQRLVGRYLPGNFLRGIVRPMLVSRAYSPRGMAVVGAGSGLLLKSNLIVVAAGLVIASVAGDSLVAWASNDKFTDAGFTLLLLFLVLAFTAQRTVIEMVMQITGHTSTLRSTALITPVALLLIWLFADHGLKVAVMIMAGGAAVSNGIAMFVLVRTTDGFRLDWHGLFATVIPALLAMVTGEYLCSQTGPLVAAVSALLLFCGCLLVTRPYNKAELLIVERSVGQRIGKLFSKLASDREG